MAVDLTIKMDVPWGTVDYAYLERIIHEALSNANIPVIDVELDATRDLSPLPTVLPAPAGPGGGAPITRPPGSYPFG